MPIPIDTRKKPVDVKVYVSTGEGVAITWSDGHTSRYDFPYLRDNCPCATCNDERCKKGSRSESGSGRGRAADVQAARDGQSGEGSGQLRHSHRVLLMRTPRESTASIACVNFVRAMNARGSFVRLLRSRIVARDFPLPDVRYFGASQRQASHTTGLARIKLSMRSSIPPCPGRSVPESFTAAARL